MDFPYPSQRMPVFARNVVATAHPLAAQAGLQVLRDGGNAVDAAIATAITLTVVEPSNNGIGSDAFAMVWDRRQLHGLNASGRSPAAWSPEYFAGKETMPLTGWDSVTVPGAVSAWTTLHERFGRRPFHLLFADAVRYAREGFAVPPRTADVWHIFAERLGKFDGFAGTFLPSGKALKSGETFRCPDQAATLEEIAETKGESFYRGALAKKIAAYAAEKGGALTEEDLAAHEPFWVDPISTNFEDVELHEIPPNGQGLAALIALGVLRHSPLADFEPDSADSLHWQIEAMKIGFAEAFQHIADPDFLKVSPERFLDPDFLKSCAKEIDAKQAAEPRSQVPTDRGTVYLTVADAGGMMVSFIQSNYLSFGSGIVVPGTGIALQNRGAGFSLEPGHPNQVAGGKRPYHTILPGFITRDGAPLSSFGVMGGHMQPQGHVQMMVRMFQQGLNPQAALDAPRWYVSPEFDVAVESAFAPEVADELRSRGHRVLKQPAMELFGGGQAIVRLTEEQEPMYVAGSDGRKDGQAVGF